jgi:hypothetical protein
VVGAVVGTLGFVLVRRWRGAVVALAPMRASAYKAANLFRIEVPASGEWNIGVLKPERQRLVTKNLRA